MKQTLFNLFPLWLKVLPHADKLVHAILGTLIYIVLLLFIPSNFAFALVVLVAILVEVYDAVSKKGTPDSVDAFATFIIPFILYLGQEIIF
jgi:uncharacterized metal-binding protein